MDVNCAICTATHLSNRHLVNVNKHRMQNATMEQIINMFKAANILVAEEPFKCFAVRTQRRIDLVFTIFSSEVVDVMRIDANNPSNGFLRGSGLFPTCYPGDATVVAAKNKWGK